MARPADDSPLEFIARQTVRLVNRGESLDHALDTLAQQAPTVAQPAVQQLRASLTGGTTDAPAGRLAVLQRLLDAVRAQSGRVDAAAVRFLQSVELPAAAVADTVQGLRSSLAYTAALLMVLIMVVLVAEIFLIPAFAEVFGNFGASMPPVTQFVFGQRWAMPLIVVLLTLGCAGLFWISHQLSRCARNLVPLPAIFRQLPGLGMLVRPLDDLFMVQSLDALLAGGLTLERARSALSAITADRVRPLLSAPLDQYLQTADRLTLLPEEVQTQLDRLAQIAALQADRFGRRLTLVLRLLLFVVIGIFVIALYQPIFQLGSAV
ncbi:MAG: hypothetical protein U1F35_17050 [Steroidobacteraceae bacterium]